MNTKTLIFGLVIALVTSVLAAVFSVGGMQYFKSKEGHEKTIFSAKQEETKVEFVEITKLVITLKGEHDAERYLLLELALTTDAPENTKKVEAMIPALRGATVNLLSDMDYKAVRDMSVTELRKKLKAAYAESAASLKVTVPFTDVIISKMVFQ